MKNLFFALAFMLVGTFAFANTFDNVPFNNIDEDFGICTVTIVEQNSDGTTSTYTYQYETSTAQDCYNSAQMVIAAHNR